MCNTRLQKLLQSDVGSFRALAFFMHTCWFQQSHATFWQQQKKLICKYKLVANSNIRVDFAKENLKRWQHSHKQKFCGFSKKRAFPMQEKEIQWKKEFNFDFSAAAIFCFFRVLFWPDHFLFRFLPLALFLIFSAASRVCFFKIFTLSGCFFFLLPN